jgi:predicted transcriptional regulator
MLDSSIQQLLEKAVDSPIKLQLCLLLYENRQLEGSATQFANRLYRDIWSVREALRQLTEDGILTATSSQGGEPIYAYRPRPEYADSIFQLAHNYNEPLERDKIQRALREIASYAPYRRSAHWKGAFEYQNG